MKGPRGPRGHSEAEHTPQLLSLAPVDCGPEAGLQAAGPALPGRCSSCWQYGLGGSHLGDSPERTAPQSCCHSGQTPVNRCVPCCWLGCSSRQHIGSVRHTCCGGVWAVGWELLKACSLPCQPHPAPALLTSFCYLPPEPSVYLAFALCCRAARAANRSAALALLH